MAFPDIRTVRIPQSSSPHGYEVQMGKQISAMLAVFTGLVPDAESHARVSELVAQPQYWVAGHKVFDEVRDRLILCQNRGQDGSIQSLQYYFEESCCQAVYNVIEPRDPFDTCCPFFVTGSALGLARALGIPAERITNAVTGKV